MFNLNREELNIYASVVKYIKGYNNSFNLSKNSLALIQYKVRRFNFQWLPVQKSKESEMFIGYVQLKFKNFDVEGFYGVNYG